MAQSNELPFLLESQILKIQDLIVLEEPWLDQASSQLLAILYPFFDRPDSQLDLVLQRHILRSRHSAF
jgi:hypothetical protein